MVLIRTFNSELRRVDSNSTTLEPFANDGFESAAVLPFPGFCPEIRKTAFRGRASACKGMIAESGRQSQRWDCEGAFVDFQGSPVPAVGLASVSYFSPNGGTGLGQLF
jgi:hypothetical protein